MADLKTTYKDDLLDTSVNEKRKYNMIQNADGTVSFEDVTTYSQIGDSFGAVDINATNEKVNEVNSNLTLDYSNARSDVQDLNTFLQMALDKLFPLFNICVDVFRINLFNSFKYTYPMICMYYIISWF